MADIKRQRRRLVRENLDQIVARVNQYLTGQKLNSVETILTRLGRNAKLPHWYPQLLEKGIFPNLDGKTVGSIIEMLFVADIEKNVLNGATTLSINPAKGVDVPDLDLGVKSPSENWCTSEPFSNAYERLLGADYDVVAVITNYQNAKKKAPLEIQLIRWHYFKGNQVADEDLCRRAMKIREHVLQFGDVPAQKVFKFLAFAVRSEWLCRILLELITSLDVPKDLPKMLDGFILRFDRDTRKRKVPLRLDEKMFLEELRSRKPLDRAIIDAADEWLIGRWHEAAQLPRGQEWERLKYSRLDGRLGISFALQWRYNFGVFFKGLKEQDPKAT